MSADHRSGAMLVTHGAIQASRRVEGVPPARVGRVSCHRVIPETRTLRVDVTGTPRCFLGCCEHRRRSIQKGPERVPTIPRHRPGFVVGGRVRPRGSKRTRILETGDVRGTRSAATSLALPHVEAPDLAPSAGVTSAALRRPSPPFEPRTGRDSNPRYPYGHTGFRDRRLQPLGHLSKLLDAEEGPGKALLLVPHNHWASRRPGVFVIRRTGWDSNPRNGCPFTRFPSVRLQPLGHPSSARGRN